VPPRHGMPSRRQLRPPRQPTLELTLGHSLRESSRLRPTRDALAGAEDALPERASVHRRQHYLQAGPPLLPYVPTGKMACSPTPSKGDTLSEGTSIHRGQHEDNRPWSAVPHMLSYSPGLALRPGKRLTPPHKSHTRSGRPSPISATEAVPLFVQPKGGRRHVGPPLGWLFQLVCVSAGPQLRHVEGVHRRHPGPRSSAWSWSASGCSVCAVHAAHATDGLSWCSPAACRSRIAAGDAPHSLAADPQSATAYSTGQAADAAVMPAKNRSSMS
jgi:hypothetical protein